MGSIKDLMLTYFQLCRIKSFKHETNLTFLASGKQILYVSEWKEGLRSQSKVMTLRYIVMNTFSCILHLRENGMI